MKTTWLKPLGEKLPRKPKVGTAVLKVKGGEVLNKQCMEDRTTWATFRIDTRRPEKKQWHRSFEKTKCIEELTTIFPSLFLPLCVSQI